MLKLLKFENYQVTIEPEIYALTPFRKLWNRDRSKSKDRAIQELSVIFFLSDPRSDYQMYLDPTERLKIITKDEGLPDTWKPDKEFMEALHLYEKFIPISAVLLTNSRIAVDKLSELLKDIDLTKTDANGKPIYTLQSIPAAVKQIPGLVSELSKAEKIVYADLTETKLIGGNQEKTLFEDGVQGL